MEKLTSWIEKYLLPVADKIGNQKHLIALRDAFIGTMPATMAGSIAVLINAIIRDMPTQFISGYDANSIPVFREIIQINGFVWNGTLAIAGLIFAFSLGYNISKVYGVNELAGGIVSLSALVQGIAFAVTTTINTPVPAQLMNEINDNFGSMGWSATADGLTASQWGWLQLSHLDGNAYFTAMILGFLSTIIYVKLMQANITIKMPDSVPPAVSKAFAAIIPATVALYTIAIFNFIFGKIASGMLFIDWVQEFIGKPLLAMSQGFGAVILATLLIQVFWFFGLHGMNILAPVLEGVWGVAQITNINLFNEGGAELVKQEGYLWVRGSFDAYAMFGGNGGTLVLIVAILLFSKRAEYRTVGKLSLGPGIFNINEPIMFGLPVVLNPIMFIPFILAPVVSTSIGYFATVAGLVNPVTQSVVWVTPPFLLSFLATGGDWRAPIVTLVSMLAAFVIYVPFVIAANKAEIKG